MSSNINIIRLCKLCNLEFEAQTTSTRYCTPKCQRKAYKVRIRTGKIEQSNNETKALISQPYEILKAKPFLSISETSNLIGISKRTIYRMIEKGEFTTLKAGTRTILRRIDIDKLFEKPKPIRVKKEPQPVNEFYTVREITDKYFVKYGRLNNIIKQYNIPKTVHFGKLHVSKPHIDRFFSRTRDNVNHIKEWYTVQEIQSKYGLSRDQTYNRTHENNIPKKRIGKYVLISKMHFDELFVIGV